MDNFSVIIFLIISFSLLVGAIRLMARGYSAQYIDPGENERPSGIWTTQVKRPVHPEMQDVKPGDQLMGVTFKSKEITECNIDDYKDLQARIDQLKDELGGDEEEDDDGGGDVVISRV